MWAHLAHALSQCAYNRRQRVEVMGVPAGENQDTYRNVVSRLLEELAQAQDPALVLQELARAIWQEYGLFPWGTALAEAISYLESGRQEAVLAALERQARSPSPIEAFAAILVLGCCLRERGLAAYRDRILAALLRQATDTTVHPEARERAAAALAVNAPEMVSGRTDHPAFERMVRFMALDFRTSLVQWLAESGPEAAADAAAEVIEGHMDLRHLLAGEFAAVARHHPEFARLAIRRWLDRGGAAAQFASGLLALQEFQEIAAQ